MKGLKFFQKTNSDAINVASYHSPHSLTWLWILYFRRPQSRVSKWFFIKNSCGWGGGFGGLCSFHRTYHNGYGHWSLMLFWYELGWNSQPAMWYRDLASHAWDREEELKYENWELRQKLTHISSEPPSSSVH